MPALSGDKRKQWHPCPGAWQGLLLDQWEVTCGKLDQKPSLALPLLNLIVGKPRVHWSKLILSTDNLQVDKTEVNGERMVPW